MDERAGWTVFEGSAPALADAARSVVELWGFMFLGTTRTDGTVRISPAEVHLVEGHLAMALIPKSRKVADILEDPRITLQSPVVDPGDPGTEVKIRGRVFAREDDDVREAIAAAIEHRNGWRPRRSWMVATVILDHIAVLQWTDGDLVLTRWDPHNGVQGPHCSGSTWRQASTSRRVRLPRPDGNTVHMERLGSTGSAAIDRAVSATRDASPD